MTDSVDPPVAGLILAAGMSSRMPGGPKSLLRFGDRSVIETVVAAATAADLRPVVVVLGHQASLIEAQLAGTEADILVHDGYDAGIFSSAAAGIRSLHDRGAEAAAVLLGDEPGIRPSDIKTVVSFWRSRRGLARARYADRPGHPVVLEIAPVADKLGSSGASNVWEALSAVCQPVFEVDLTVPAPIDIDDPQGYERAISRLKKEQSGAC
ncbi:MAG: NTP transferase domain-containing protein [Gemmatimonadota bacterium]